MDIGRIIRNNQRYFEDFITRSTYHSNAIEGNTLSYAATYAIIFNDNDFKISAAPREIYEAINHKYGIDYILKEAEQKTDLSEKMIKDLAVIINKNISEISGYRTVQVRIRGAEHIPPAPFEVPQKMMYFAYNYNHTQYDSIFDKIADAHIQIERIHPFEDGNGRTGRLILNFELLKNEYAPIVVPKDRKSEYFQYLASSDYNGLSLFFKELELKELEHLEKFAEMEAGLKDKLGIYQFTAKVKERINNREAVEKEKDMEK